MACVTYEDDWVHVDDCSKEVERLENRIEDLKEEIENHADDEVYTLAEIMLARDKLLHGMSVYEVVDDLNKLIAAHGVDVRMAAVSKINELEEASK